MKTGCFNFIIINIFLALFYINLSAQTDSLASDSVSISTMLQSEIENIKTKEAVSKPAEVAETETQSEEKDETVFLGMTQSLLIRIFLITDLVLAAVLFIIWRRRKERIAKELKAKFKSNIKKLREEKIKGKEDERLKALRKNLQTHPICGNLNDTTVSNQAKKLSISKGEIYLAAKIKSYNRDEDA